MPTPDEARRLQISTGVPVAELTWTAYTAEDKPVRVMVAIIPGDTLVLQVQNLYLKVGRLVRYG